MLMPVVNDVAIDEDALARKDYRILGRLATHMCNHQIAAAAFLTEGTVKNYTSRVREQLHFRIGVEVALRAANLRC